MGQIMITFVRHMDETAEVKRKYCQTCSDTSRALAD